MRLSILSLLGLLLLTGCAVQKNITITTRPPDAMIRINGAERGRGPIEERFTFQNPGDIFYVTATRKGFQDKTVPISRDTADKRLYIEMRPQVKRITIGTNPVPAIISINGKPLTGEPASGISADVEFTVDPQDNWIPHTITAERRGFLKSEMQINYTDPQAAYTLKLDPMRKDLRIITNPPGATISIDGKEIGASPLTDKDRPFEFDVNTNNWVDHTIRVSKAGFDSIERKISWDNGQVEYNIDLIPKQKSVSVKSDPPGAMIAIEGVTTKETADGIVADLVFAPVDDRGNLKVYKVKATKKTAESEWYPAEMPLAWDEGKGEYVIKLREILNQPTDGLAFNFVREKNEWHPRLETVKAMSMKFVTELEGDQPQQIVKLSKGQCIGSVSISPDGQNILYSVLSGDAENPVSQMFRTNTDGTGGATALSDGRSVDLTPSYSIAGDRIVFSSNRASKKFNIWSISSDGTGGVTRLTTNTESNDIWPSVDADAKPRLFYQAYIDTRSDARLYMSQIGTILQTDLTRLGGMMPRVSPKSDSILYSVINEKTGKRDIYRVSDRGNSEENLTIGVADNTDPSWNASGKSVVFASDRGVDAEDKRANMDIYVLDLNGNSQPRRITSNGSVDDMPVFDPSGDTIYFRSNRGGTWGIWRVSNRK